MNTHVKKELDEVQRTYVKEPVDQLIENVQEEVINNPDILKSPTYVEFLDSAIQMTPFELRFYRNGDLVLNIEQARKLANEPLKVIRDGVFSDKNGDEYIYEVSVKDRDPKMGYVSRFNQRLLQYGILFLIVYGVLHVIFFKYALRTVFGPLDRMKAAALHIRDEEYNEPLEYMGRDEVGEVFHAFDEMRIHFSKDLPLGYMISYTHINRRYLT
jgi:methyl-accepting chemotaxis protein